jgi:ectoine hydroxylase-related dioxygenase (phytanoyl-CoA dioxygenase family)
MPSSIGLWIAMIKPAYSDGYIAAVLAQIVGAHLREFWDHSVKCMQSMFFVKGTGKPGQAWHQDEIYTPTRDRSLCGAWIAVDDATVANGCLWVIPGSHRAGILYSNKPHNRPDEFDFAPESYGFEEGFDEGNAIPVEVPAGSVVFFNGYLLHRSLKNRSDGYRRVLVNHYCSGQTRLPWCHTEHDIAVAATDDRRVFMVHGEDGNTTTPLATPDIKDVWCRTEG